VTGGAGIFLLTYELDKAVETILEFAEVELPAVSPVVN
jgi:hypothetical protein